jgi:hypothetical protein
MPAAPEHAALMDPEAHADSSGGTAGKRIRGRPFRKGQSGNAGGRRKSLAGIIRKGTKDGGELIAFLLQLMRGQVKGASASDRLRACTELCDRAFGRPVQTVDLDASIGVHGVLMIPTPVSAEEWSAVTQEQQRELKAQHLRGA